ncbi:putative serine/threonine-protein kinase nek2 [Cucumis melo var. makuwa]|uniref:Putative serine/threonine-protein kinase nek2 n=1 Tax=Cucumis melo var. makuwa TaxID=1194695 RepID=A0A5D3BRU8_CUCMM|nr:putative serine/threonine-protein kinase nek2 [Cucumis melo var. makuwa]
MWNQNGMQDRIEEPSDPEKAYEIERLKKLGATMFKGSTDPTDVENWLNMLEKYFDVMNCPEERKVKLATFLLQNEAEGWWKSILTRCRQDIKSRSGGQSSRQVLRIPLFLVRFWMLEPLYEELVIYTLVGDALLVNEVLVDYEVLVKGISMLVDLLPLELYRLDVILEMVFIFTYHASMDYHKKEVVFRKPSFAEVVFRKLSFAEVVFRGGRKIIPISLISVLKNEKLMRKGCTTFLAHMVEVQREKLKSEDVPVVKEFLNVFPDDLSAIPNAPNAVTRRTPARRTPNRRTLVEGLSNDCRTPLLPNSAIATIRKPNVAPLLVERLSPAPFLAQYRTTISIMKMTKLSVGFFFQFVVDDELPNASFYGESSKFDTHTCEENDVGSVKEMIEVHEEYPKDPNGFEKLLVDVEKPLKEFANATECPECGHSRWKNIKDRNEERKQIFSKVIWYFSPIPRFKRLFRSIEWAENLTWHASERIEDRKLRHPADSPAWKFVDFKWPDFGSKPRNLCLALSADGVNPHGTLLDILGKSKDGLNAKRDLVGLKFRPELASISSEKKIFIPPACYTLTKEEKRCVLKTLSRIKLFPIALRSMLPKHVRYAITRLCIFFNSVCNKVLDAQQLNKLEEDIVIPLVRYNEDGASIGENGAKLKSFIRYATHYHVPITYTSWKSVPPELKDKIFTTVEAAFVIDPRSRKNILQTANISFRQFKNWLTTKYIMPHKDDLQLLQAPSEKYSFIEQNHWEEFVRSRLSETFQEGSNEVYVDRAKMWKKARVNKQGQYDNDDIQQVVHKIDEISMNTDSSSVNRHCSNDVLTQALVKKTSKDEVNILVENEELRKRVSELEAQIRSNLSTPLSAHGSCSRPIMLEGIEEKGKTIEVESLDKPKENEKKGKEAMKMNEPELDVLKETDLIKMPTEKEVVCESTSTLPLTLKSILRYAEKVMEKDSSITFSLPTDLFGIS